MSDLLRLFRAQDATARWRAEYENASARLDKARTIECAAFLISQHEPLASLGINREQLSLVLDYVTVHRDLARLVRETRKP